MTDFDFEKKHLTREQTHALFEAAETENILYPTLLRTIYTFGLRAREACRLDRDDYDPKRSSLVVRRQKGGMSQNYPVPARLCRYLDDYLAARDDKKEALFVSQMKRRRISYRGVHYIVKRVAKKAGIPDELCHPHALRHSIAIHMLEREKSMEFIAAWLGHQSPTTTAQMYARFTPEHLAREAEGMDWVE